MYTKEELEQKIEEETKMWEEQSEGMRQQFNQAFGVFNGRIGLYKEMLGVLNDDSEFAPDIAGPDN